MWLAEIEIWRLQRKENTMGLFGSKPKDETPSEEDYDLNAINEIHSRTKDFLNVGDYEANDLIVAERKRYEQEHGIATRWDRQTDSFERRRR